MKKILFLTLFIIPIWGFSQTTPIDGFLGVKFGSSKLAVITALKAKGAVLNKEGSGPDILIFQKVKLGNRSSNALVVMFTNNKAYCGLFDFELDDQPKVIDYYHSLVKDIEGKYGPGSPIVDFKSPFKDGDGNELVAFQQGYATMFTDWTSGKGSIRATIHHEGDNLSVMLFYTDDELKAQVDAKENSKQKSDL
ncbi:MAG TPA: hypothetical protein VGC01_05005 [Mucilaginibacter sp.]